MKKFNLICTICDKEFESSNKNTKTCSRSCRSKYVWTRDYEQRAALNKEIANRPSVKEKISKAHKKIQNEPARKELQSANSKKRWADEKYKDRVSKKIKEHHNTDDYKNKASRINSEIANRKSVSKAKSKAMRHLYNTTDLRERMIVIQKEIHSRKSYKQKFSRSMRKRWEDPVFAERMFKSWVSYKDYVLPSGEIVKVQGYESKALEILLTVFKEHDILINLKDIHNRIGIIRYNFELKDRRYYPDFYIKSTNTIIEVKSQWTFDKWKEKNLAKQKACLEQGFNFKFIIL
ncbi:MAG TPA: hypothetical protein P5509_05675 [Bacteroidales bacterium]|nr:hypothetical protein [Bacteroidales bacterium]